MPAGLELPTFKGRPGWEFTDITKLDWYEVATSAMNYVSIFHPPEPPGTPEWVQTSDTPLVLDNWQNNLDLTACNPGINCGLK